MATYMELRGLFADSDLNSKIEVAVIIAADHNPTISMASLVQAIAS